MTDKTPHYRIVLLDLASLASQALDAQQADIARLRARLADFESSPAAAATETPETTTGEKDPDHD